MKDILSQFFLISSAVPKVVLDLKKKKEKKKSGAESFSEKARNISFWISGSVLSFKYVFNAYVITF